MVEEAARYDKVVKMIEEAYSLSSDAAAKQRFKTIIAKLKDKPPKKLSDDDVKFCC